jgi:hypothetical protein
MVVAERVEMSSSSGKQWSRAEFDPEGEVQGPRPIGEVDVRVYNPEFAERLLAIAKGAWRRLEDVGASFHQLSAASGEDYEQARLGLETLMNTLQQVRRKVLESQQRDMASHLTVAQAHQQMEERQRQLGDDGSRAVLGDD